MKGIEGNERILQVKSSKLQAIYELQDENLVILVIDINHRKDVYG